MNRILRTLFISIVVAFLTSSTFAQRLASEELQQNIAAFAAQVDYDSLGRIAVHSDGRLKSYGSYARSTMQFISGPHSVRGQTAAFTHFDLIFRPRAYEDAELIYIKNKPVRERIVTELMKSVRPNLETVPGGADELAKLEERGARFIKTGLIPALWLRDTGVAALLGELRQDLITTAKVVEDIETALAVMNADLLRRNLRIVPPPGGDFEDRWYTLDELAELERVDPRRYAAVDKDLKLNILREWDVFQAGWREMDATRVNAAAARLADLLPKVNPDLYESSIGRTGWPWSITEGSGWAWTSSIGLGLLSFVLALLFIMQRRPTAAAIAATCAVSAVIFHGTGLYLGTQNPLTLESWYFATRNMTWVWLFYMAAIVPLLAAIIFRWRGAHGLGMALFLVAFGFHTAALFIRWYVSGRWPNSNMFEAITTAAWFGGCCAIVLELCVRRLPMRSLFALGSAVSSMVALMAVYYLPVQLDPNIRNMMPVLHDVWLYIHTNVIIVSYCLIFMAAVTGTLYLLYRLIGSMRTDDYDGTQEFARMGGAASLIQTTPSGEAIIVRAKSSLGQVLDGTTMVLMELSFVLLWAGLVMGAIWADHSWGRPWGWDPKEVFALNTFIVFAVLIHTRLKVKDKGFWTAIIALIGAGVMLFNWIAINFVVVGLHSYA